MRVPRGWSECGLSLGGQKQNGARLTQNGEIALRMLTKTARSPTYSSFSSQAPSPCVAA
jgi:hypothetical protein